MNGNNKDKKIQFVSLTNYLRKLPDTKTTTVLTLFASVVIGVLGFAVYVNSINPLNLVWYGSIMGLVFLGIPSVLAGWLSFFITKPMRKELLFNRSSYLAFAGMMVVGITYLLGIICSLGNAKVVFDLMIFGYIIVFAVRVFALMLTHPYNIIQASGIAAIHPALGFAFMVASTQMITTSSVLPLPPISPVLMLAKITIGFSIFLIGVMLIILLINAPAKRIFGASTFKLAGTFLAHWLDGSTAIEKELEPLSEKTDAYVGLASFKAKNRLKSLFIIPYLHPGPFGEVGGGKLTRALTQVCEKELGATVIIPHGTATHDLNPLQTDDIYRIAEECVDAVKKIKHSPSATPSVRVQRGKSKVLAQSFGDSALLISTFAPEPTEDIDFTIGLAVMNKLEKHYKNVICVDAHNSHHPGHHTMYSGDPMMFELIDAMNEAAKKLSKQKKNRLRLGVAVDDMRDYSVREGIGYAGLRAAVISAGKNSTALIVFDANNIVSGAREKIIERIKRLGLDEVEVLTTDTHSVNSIQGVDNPVGARIPVEVLVRRSEEAVKKALKDLEEVSAGTAVIKVKDVEVFGAQKATEIVATINSMVSMLSIIAPLVMGGAIALSLLSVLFIPW
ncbi:MAG: DUF2070 family protein [archaeon]